MRMFQIERNEKGLRRIFGKVELLIIRKQLIGMRLSASERTRLSRDIRPKLEVIFKLTGHNEGFRLKKGQEVKILVDEVVEEVLKSSWGGKIRKIVLFGSCVDGTMMLDSDVDVAVFFKDINVRSATKFRIEMLGRVSDKIDLQVYNILPKKIKSEIDKKGKVVFGG